LVPTDHPDVPHLVIDMGESFRRSERAQLAEGAFTQGLSLARASGDRQAEARATLYLLNIEVDEGRISLDALLAALGELEEKVAMLRDPETAAHAAALLGAAYIRGGALARARAQWVLAVEEADQTQSNYARSETRVGTLLASLWGPDHVDDVVARARDYLRWAEETGALRLRAAALAVLAMGSTMQDKSDEAHSSLETLSQVEATLGMNVIAGEAWSVVEPDLHLLRGDWLRAELVLASRLEVLERMGVEALMTLDMAQMGEALYRQGRLAEAELLARRVRPMICNDIDSEIRARRLLGKCLVRQGKRGEAVAREAVDIARGTDMINLTADALCDLGEVLTLEGGRQTELREPLEEALALYQRKGNVASAGKIRSWLARL
jgi:tetratricopeptide (TPR) repeat protein